MLKAIANALASLWRGVIGVASWTEQLLRWPFNLIFGSRGRGTPTPEYKPDVTAEQLLNEYEEARAREAALHNLDRDGISTVAKFANSQKRVRDDMDLSAVNSEARFTLLTMDEHELKALSVAGPGQIRKFLRGQQHGIFGVPVVKVTENRIKPACEMKPKEPGYWRVHSRVPKTNIGHQFKFAH